jgi:glycosyltransferase involved in cell wall biosynthesis
MTDSPQASAVDAPLVSVLTPVHNGADYLPECIESVLAQTYPHWDYTIVDNASTDATPEIAERYALRDSRIRYLRFEELVDSTANHNRAFETMSAESEFCKVVQADDWLYPQCLSLMVEAASQATTIGLVGAYQLWGRRVHLYGLPYTTTFVRGRDILRGTLLGQFNVTGGPTATMLRSRCIRERKPFWNQGFRHEDTEAVLRLLSSHDFAFVHQVLSFARRQEGSQITWSHRMNSVEAEDIVFLLRYGPSVLEAEEYRRRLRLLLKSYAAWHVRQAAHVSRLRDPEFFEFQDTKRRQILAEANGEPEVVAAMGVVGALLLRGAKRGRRRSRPAGQT